MRSLKPVFTIVVVVGCLAQQPSDIGSPHDPAGGQGATISAAEKKKKERALRRELEGPWKNWLQEDVIYIITPEEAASFKRLQTDDERRQWVEEFWLRRDPTPETFANEFKEEHYRRIACANELYAEGMSPGWKTDRGRIYIKYGPPDEIQSRPASADKASQAVEEWLYRNIEGMGPNIRFQFADVTGRGMYYQSNDPEKDAVANLQPANVRTDAGPAGLSRPPKVPFKELTAIANSHINYHTLPIAVQVDYSKTTRGTDLAYITLQFRNSDLQFVTKDGVARATILVQGDIKLSGRPVDWFEDTVEASIPADMLPQVLSRFTSYSKIVPIRPDFYKMLIVAKDAAAGTVATYEAPLNLPHYDQESLLSSSVLLDRVPNKKSFALESSGFSAHPMGRFRRDAQASVYVEFYNLGMDEGTLKPSGTVESSVVNLATKQRVLEFTDDLSQFENASPSQVGIKKILLMSRLEPGNYALSMKVVDNIKKQTFTAPEAKFSVTAN